MGKRKQTLLPFAEPSPSIAIVESAINEEPSGSSDALRKRNRRQNAAQEQIENERKTDRERKRSMRESRSEASQSERMRDRQRKRSVRDSETQASRLQRLESLRNRAERLRNNETDDETQVRLTEQALRTQNLRQNETELEHNRRITDQLQRTRNIRQNETENDHQTRLSAQLQRTQALRENETDDERQSRLIEQQRRTLQNRIKANVRFNLIAANSVEELNEELIMEHNCGQMNKVCSHCDARHFSKELPTDGLFTICCNKGSVKLPRIETDDYIKGLLDGTDPDSKSFMESIRSYNCAFGFVSVGVKLNMPTGIGPYCFRIHGQVYHRTSTLHPDDGEKRSFSQLYILDEDLAIAERLSDPANAACKNHIMEKLTHVMNTNPFGQAYKMMHEVEESEKNKAEREGKNMPKITMALLQNRNQDQRRYNAQKCSEVAVIFTSAAGEPPLERDLRIHLKCDKDSVPKMQQVSILHKNLEALCYPVLFPKGEQGWGDDVMLSNPRGTGEKARKRVTLKMYYSYYLQIRDYFNPMLSAGRLTQQYIVDAYVKAEANDLNYIRTHQKELRCDSYTNVLSHHLAGTASNNRSSVEEAPVGKKIILPSSFSGSPRNMQELYQDAMAIVRKFGKPDLFVTMTCNPKWQEITENLPAHDRVENRPDLVARVFKLKLSSLLEDIVKKEVFGKLIAKVHVIEFQKRGLPHAHILITLNAEYKPRTPNIVDRIVCAEIPDPIQHPRLHAIVMKNMIHGPCGKFNSRSPCMVDGKCSKKFPKKFIAETLINNDGYPAYRRRQTADTIVGKHKINNSWVVPFNPYLSLKYNCHVNVEVCASFKSVKYLFKYAYKGTDCANVEVRVDEINNFIDSRYVSPPEAMWRIYRFPMNDQTHAIIRLTVHLQDDPFMTFQPNRLAEELQRAGNRDTTLTAWFKLNQADASARQYFYYEIPEHYVFQERDRKWTPRKRGHNKVIGRILPVGVKETERYFLRLTLLHTKGACSFNDLLTVNCQQFESFYEVAKFKGLVLDEDIWRITLEEASGAGMPYQLRELFAYLCLYSNIVNASGLWNQFRDHLSEDFARRHGHDIENDCNLCSNHALLEIQRVLTVHGKEASDFKLPTPTEAEGNFQEEVDMQEELRLFHEMENTLNQEQSEAFQSILTSLNDRRRMKSKCFFLDGPGGTGKTYLYKCLIHKMRKEGKNVLPVASTGIAANLLKGGRTYHSEFKVPLQVSETMVCGIPPGESAARRVRQANLVIWDESTMASAMALECVDRLFKEVMKTDTTFGGKTILLGGDFRQTLPILPGADSAATVQGSLKHSRIWYEFQQLKLSINVRSLDPEYSEWLMMLGNGDLSNDDGLDPDLIEIPEHMLTNNKSIVREVFGESFEASDIQKFYNTAILCPKNDDADEINAEVLRILMGEEKAYLSLDSLVSEDNEDVSDYPPVFKFVDTFRYCTAQVVFEGWSYYYAIKKLKY